MLSEKTQSPIGDFGKNLGCQEQVFSHISDYLVAVSDLTTWHGKGKGLSYTKGREGRERTDQHFRQLTDQQVLIMGERNNRLKKRDKT